jgi:hypothetical protein
MSWTKTRSEIATTLQHHPLADVTELRRRLKAERLEEHIRSIVDSAPPLSDEQRARLMLLLAPRGGVHDELA